MPLSSLRSHVLPQDVLLALYHNVGLKGIAFWWRARKDRRQLYRPERNAEEPKLALSSNKFLAFVRCWVHFLPICTTITLASINIHGFYIGANLEGPHPSYSSDIDILSLQSTAKLYELLIGASLATIVVDVLHHHLIYDTLPFGLIAAHLQLAQLSYFWSPEFWCGRGAISKRRRRLFLTTLLLMSGLIVLAAGPSSALLLVPRQSNGWHAGGSDYYIAGNASTNWPDILDINAVGARFLYSCLNPDVNTLYPKEEDGSSGCIWAGSQSLQQSYRDAHSQYIYNLTIADGSVTRTLQRFIDSCCTAPHTIAPNLGATAPSYYFGLHWINATQQLRGVSSYAHYKRLIDTDSTFIMDSYMPLVRAKCTYNVNYTSSDPEAWLYPFLPAWGAEEENLSYKLSPGQIIQSNFSTTQWRTLPSGPSTLTNGSTVAYYPSAFLNVQIPHNLSQIGGGLYTCSVDARWVYSTNVGTSFNFLTKSSYTVAGTLPTELRDFPFTSNTIPEQNALPITQDWLNTLTPPLDDSGNGNTTLAAAFESSGFNAWYQSQDDAAPAVESMIATVVADGMSRIGYSRNGGGYTIIAYFPRVFDRYNISISDFQSKVYKGTAKIPPPTTMAPFGPDYYDTTNSTLLRWDIYIAGYYYKADSAASWVALAILFAHTVLALAHITWRMVRHETINSWGSISELLALAQNSSPSSSLGDTCAGIYRGRTMAKRACVKRVDESELSSKHAAYSGEQLQLIFEEDGHDTGLCKQVEPDILYGAL